MAKVFEKMAAVAGFEPADLEEFIGLAGDLAGGEIGAVMGYILGRLDSHDAVAMVEVLRRSHPQRRLKIDGRTTVNVVGTGGGPSTFNITTTAAFVIAAGGAVVVKTGSNACRSKSGFADVAAKLGTLKLSMPWEEIESIAADVGIVFVPPAHYSAVLGMLEQRLTPPVYRNAASYFNKLGPLLSPVRVDHHFIGANSLACVEMLAGAVQGLGDLPATLLAADDGMDEASTTTTTHWIHVSASGERRDVLIDPRSLDIAPPEPGALDGYEPAAAAQCCEQILSGNGNRAQTEIVALNAGIVLTQLGMYANLAAGYRAALEILKGGGALDKLHSLRSRVWKCVKR